MAEYQNKRSKAERRQKWIEEHRPALNRIVAAMVAIIVSALLAACYVIWALMAAFAPPN